jgi:hypothetical protein
MATPEPIMPATSAEIPTAAANPAPTAIAPIEPAPAPVAAAAEAPVVAPAALPTPRVETTAVEAPSPLDVPTAVIVPTEPDAAPAVAAPSPVDVPAAMFLPTEPEAAPAGEVPAATANQNAQRIATTGQPAEIAMATDDPRPVLIARPADPPELLQSKPPAEPPAEPSPKPLITPPLKPPTQSSLITRSSDQRPGLNASIAIKVNSTQVMEFSIVLPPGASIAAATPADGPAATPAGSGIGPSRSEQARNARRRREQTAVKRKSPQPNRRTRQGNRHFIN